MYAVSASGAAIAVPIKPNIIAGINKNNLIKLDIINLRLSFLYLKDLTKIIWLKGSKKNVGKPVKKDKRKGKSTLIKLLGYKKTLEFALRRKKMIMGKLRKYGTRSNELIRTLNFILDRSY